MAKESEGKPDTYLNPVYPLSFPDPFVLKFSGEYFGYSTGYSPDENVFEILRSSDLVHWARVGSAMRPLEPSPPYYWAPEVTYDNGKFYLYYSTGNETLMELRVAISDRPDGGFKDSGTRLTNEEFAIDAHVFIDDDGSRYMFYATDFLEHTHIGTGTVVDRMIDWFTLEGRPRPVTRARYDWQVYDPARKEKGGVRWHTVEGPTILKRKGKYFEMFSGGNWQNKTYGVSFAITNDIGQAEEWGQFSDGEKVLPILRTIPERVIGPGHNSVVRGPNNREMYCVYHRWTDAGRVLAIDRMDFAGDRLFVAGPSTEEQLAPFKPIVTSSLDAASEWSRTGNAFFSKSDRRCELAIAGSGGTFICECTFRFVTVGSGPSFGYRLDTTEEDIQLTIEPERSLAILSCGDKHAARLELPRGFDPTFSHLLRVDAGVDKCHVMIDDRSLTASVKTKGTPGQLSFFSEAATVEIASVELTPGFEELFEEAGRLPSVFDIAGGQAEATGRAMHLTASGEAEALVILRTSFHDFELAVNLAVSGEQLGRYGLVLLSGERNEVGRLSIDPERREINLAVSGEHREVALPEAFSGLEYRQLRIIHYSGRIAAYLDGIETASLACLTDIKDAAIFSEKSIDVDMVRLTSIRF